MAFREAVAGFPWKRRDHPEKKSLSLLSVDRDSVRMNCSAVYESEDGSDADSCCSGEQVIEISSHSRIIVSPRKVRASAWSDKLQRSPRRRVKTYKKTESRSREETSVRRSFGSSSSRSTARTRRNSSLRSNGSNQVASPARKTAKKRRNYNESSGSEEESDGVISSGHGDSSDDSDVSYEEVVKKPTRRSSPRKHTLKKTESRTYLLDDSLGDSIQSFGSPTTPGKEMEELKTTLKNLARHDSGDDKPTTHATPTISSTSALREYLTAATAFSGSDPAGQTRPTEPAALKSGQPRHASFHHPRSNVFSAPTRVKSKSMRDNTAHAHDNQKDAFGELGGSSSTRSGSERFSLNKKLFSVPPPPANFTGSSGLGVPFQSTGVNGNGGAQGSRAVLSALKALQDKIGRLEEEREGLKQQLSDAKLTARKREAELASAEKKFSYELGQTKESARAAYDALRCDREELKLQLVKSEERGKATQVELAHFQELTKTLSDKSEDLQSQLQISEAHRTRVKTEMKGAESDHKRVLQETQAELTQLRQQLQTATERSELLEAQFQRESSNHAESKERLQESEQTVASLSQLNEKLVAKVWEATEAANQAVKKHKKLLQQQRPSTLLRPTAASRASAAAASEATARRRGNAASTTTSQGNSGASPARTVKKKKTASSTNPSTSKKLKQPKAVNNMTLLREANLGKEIPFLLGNSAQPSFSLIGNIQDALRRCDTTYVMPTLHGSTPTTPGSTSSHHQAGKQVRHRVQSGGITDEENVDDAPRLDPPPAPSSPVSATENAIPEPAPQTQTPKSSSSTQRRSTKHKPPAIKVPTVSPKTYASPMQVRWRPWLSLS